MASTSEVLQWQHGFRGKSRQGRPNLEIRNNFQISNDQNIQNSLTKWKEDRNLIDHGLFVVVMIVSHKI